MKRDIKEILGSADAERIAEDYKVVDRKTSQRMFSSYLKKVGTANNQFSETTEKSEVYKVEKAVRIRRITSFTAYAAAFVLLIGATAGIIKMKGPKNTKLEPPPQPEISATESQTETWNNSSENPTARIEGSQTETADNSSENPTDRIDEKTDREKATSHSASSVTKPDSDNNSKNTDAAINESESNNSSEPKTNDDPDKNDEQAATPASENVEKPTSEYMDDNMTQIVKKQIELTDKLNSLNYIDACVEAEPEYYFTARDGNVYKLSLSLNIVQRNDANLQATLTPDITEIIEFFISQGAVLATPEQFNMLYGQGTVNETPTSTDDLIFESGLFRKLNALSYQPMTCDGLPEYQIQDKEGNVFEVNLSEGWVWRRNPTNGKPAPEEADLTSETLGILISLRDRGELNPCAWN